MKLFGNKIVTKTPIPLAEALAKKASKVRTLDEILADIDAKKKASAAPAPEAKPVVAAAQPTAPAKVEPKPELKAEAKVEVKANLENLGDKKAPPFGSDKKDDKKEKEEASTDKTPEKTDKKDDKKEKEECCASAKPTILKMAKSLDFRDWEAEDVINAWQQHGSFEKCVSNVQKLTSDAKTYCSLLKEASVVADKVIKVAAQQKQVKTNAARVEIKKTAIFKKIAKMTEKERTWLRGYFSNLYGPAYVEAMLSDY